MKSILRWRDRGGNRKIKYLGVTQLGSLSDSGFTGKIGKLSLPTPKADVTFK